MNFTEASRRQAAVSALSAARPFHGLLRGDLEMLASVSSPLAVTGGERVYSEDDWGGHLLVVAAGLIRTALLSPSGPSVTIDVVPAGRVVGCFHPVCKHRHVIEALAMVETHLLKVPKKAYARLLTRNLDFASATVAAAAQDAYEFQMARARLVLPSEQRVLASLLWLQSRVGPRIPMTRSDLAEVASVARETAIRALSPFEKKGWIRTRRGRIEIVATAPLQAALEAARS